MFVCTWRTHIILLGCWNTHFELNIKWKKSSSNKQKILSIIVNNSSDCCVDCCQQRLSNGSRQGKLLVGKEAQHPHLHHTAAKQKAALHVHCCGCVEAVALL